MKFLALALFVVAAVAVPIPEESSDGVEVIVNGVPEGTPLELGGIVDMHLNEHVNGQLASSSNLLHPYTAVGIAEAAAAAAAEVIAPNPIQIVEESKPEALPEAVVLPEPIKPEVLPSPIVMPSPVAPEVAIKPEPIVMPTPAAPEVVIMPESIVMPSPVAPEVEIPEPVVLPGPSPPMVIDEVENVDLPEPAALGPNDLYNDGILQVSVNAPEDAGMFSTLQSWFSMVVNYISNGIQTSQQIV